MLQSVDLVWLYVGAVGVLALAALAFDLMRAFSRRSGRSTVSDGASDGASGDMVPGHQGEVTRDSPSRVLRRLARSPATVRSGNDGQGSVVPAASATGRDREFLPAALEILETPPSPVAMSLMVTICALVVAALAWSYFGWLDIHAVAQGKVQPSGRTKVVQPLDAGKVASIHVEAGKHVSQGQLLVELDPTETVADVVALERELESATAETVRRRAAIAAAQSGDWSQRPISFPEIVTLPVQLRERSLLDAELDQLEAVATSLKSQLAERRATQQRLQGSIDARKRLLDLARERVGMREEIQARGAGSRALIIEAEMQYENYVTADAADRGQLIEVAAAVRSLDRRIDQAVTQFVADQTQKLVDVNRRRDRL